MKLVKKIIAIVLVLVFAMAMFAGCKDDGTIKPKVLEVQLIPSQDASVLDAAFTFKDARNLFEDEDNFEAIKETCVFLMNTTIIPNDTISVIPNLNADLKEKVKRAFLNIAASEAGLEIIRAIYSHEGYAEAKDSDYDTVREYLARKKEWNFN